MGFSFCHCADLYCASIIVCVDSDVPCAALVSGVKVGWAFGLSIIEWITQQLFKMSREYRQVSVILEHNKLRIKMNPTDRELRCVAVVSSSPHETSRCRGYKGACKWPLKSLISPRFQRIILTTDADDFIP